MDDIKRPMQNRGSGAPLRRRDYTQNTSHYTFYPAPASQRQQPSPTAEPKPAKSTAKAARQAGYHPLTAARFREALELVRPLNRRYPVIARSAWGFMALLMFSTVLMQAFNYHKADANYHVSSKAETLVGKTSPQMAKSLVLDQKNNVYEYNKDYTVSDDVAGHTSGPKFSASFPRDPAKGVVVTDPVTKASLTIAPEFSMAQPVQDENRLVYPLNGRDAQKVYTLKANGYKEDILLNAYQGDTLSFSYNIQASDGAEARLNDDGSVGVYGVESTLMGNVTTSTDADAALLKKARENGQKNNLLFTLPAPTITELSKKESKAKTWFSLEKGVLTVHAKNLKQAQYPLSIDPTVYVDTAAKLMRGNNETNVDFDPDNELLQKSQLSGARFNTWTASSVPLPSAAQRFDAGSAIYGGYIYNVGGRSGAVNTSTVYWAKINANTHLVEAPNPGNGVCTSWCTDTAYDLPLPRASFSLKAYNGFLYVIGGRDGSCGSSSFCTTVYVAKLGANGEPSLWHPTDKNQANWVYWYSDTAIGAGRANYYAATYNNHMYVIGGIDDTVNVVNTSYYADIRPNGTINNWNTTVALPTTRYGGDAQVYNDRMYVLGGYSSGTLLNEVRYIKINTDGTFSGSWTATNGFTGGRVGWGGNFSTILNGYMYVSGGCTAAATTGLLDNCTSAGITGGGTFQLASINADGTVGSWNTIIGITNARIGYGLQPWQGALFGIGGCTAQAANEDCSTMTTAVNYGIINEDGDASTVATSVASGTSPCSGGAPTQCNQPTDIGNLLNISAIMNGYLYVIGGCITNDCSSGGSAEVSGDTLYTAIQPDGTLVRPTACVAGGGTYSDSYCKDNIASINAQTTSGTARTGVAAAGVAVFNSRIYIVGGFTGYADGIRTVINYIDVNADGSLNGTTWSSSTLPVGLSYTYAYARANPAAAATNPGNLYIFGGCTDSATAGAGCTSGSNTQAVYKCNIATNGSVAGCTTTGQLQIGTPTGATGSGLALHSGTVYANYIYLIGGVAPGVTDLKTIRYAKFDNNNNVVTAGTGWVEDNSQTSVGRRRAASFGYNGYLYVVGGYDGSGGGSVLSDIQFAKINVSDGSLDDFQTSAVVINQRWGLNVAVSSSYAYVMGGCTTGAAPASCTARTTVVQTFQIYNNDSGVPAAFNASAGNYAASTDRWGANAAVLNGYLYVAGGCTSATDCTTAISNVQKAPLDATTGAIGTWASTTAALPAVRAWGQLQVAGGYLYYLGGQDSTATNEQSTIYYALPSGAGDVTTWGTASGGIGDLAGAPVAQARSKFGSTVWNNRIYVVGGLNASAAATNTVYVSPQLNSGGNIAADSWTSDSDVFNVARFGGAVTSYANNLYIVGGNTGSVYLSDVQLAQINSDGSIEPWKYSTNLPGPISQGEAFAANGYLYLVGGRSANAVCSPSMLVAPISANTTIATGNLPTGLGEWFETNARYTGDRYGMAVAYDQGKLYMMGGGCTAPLTTNRHYNATLKSQPAVAKYSIEIDEDSDVYPAKWLANGLDNSVGAAWYMRYKSATDYDALPGDCSSDMLDWGQETNFGKISLGTPQVYTARDGSGTDTKCARYYFLSVNIDSSQAFGYPEDVSRGPTIYDLSLTFTADPAKRLIHGKTFTGGVQQPLDTPF